MHFLSRGPTRRLFCVRAPFLQAVGLFNDRIARQDKMSLEGSPILFLTKTALACTHNYSSRQEGALPLNHYLHIAKKIIGVWLPRIDGIRHSILFLVTLFNVRLLSVAMHFRHTASHVIGRIRRLFSHSRFIYSRLISRLINYIPSLRLRLRLPRTPTL